MGAASFILLHGSEKVAESPRCGAAIKIERTSGWQSVWGRGQRAFGQKGGTDLEPRTPMRPEEHCFSSFVLPMHLPLAKVFPRLYTCSGMVFLTEPHGTMRGTPDREPEYHVILLCDLGQVLTSFGPQLLCKQNKGIIQDVPTFHFFPFRMFYDMYF